jgi:MFS family permease
MLLLARVDDRATWAGDVLAPSLLCSAGIGASFVPAMIAATSAVTAADSGLASGLLNTAYHMGSSLGLALLATLAANGAAPVTDGFREAFVTGAGLAFAAAAIALLVLVRAPRTARPHTARS